MPLNVQNAAPLLVMPFSLCTQYRRSQQYQVIANDYKNGESQRSAQTTTSRKSWDLSKRLMPALLAAQRAFFESVRGPYLPFYFYDVYETTPRFQYDATGAATAGRYTVRYVTTQWAPSVGIARADVSVSLIELA
jgi:hypothetical protein